MWHNAKEYFEGHVTDIGMSKESNRSTARGNKYENTENVKEKRKKEESDMYQDLLDNI